jgi:xylulokinase
VILTVDLGTTLTKVVLWERDGPVARAGIPVRTVHPAPGWAEQAPSEWWSSVVAACAQLRAHAGRRFGPVEAVGCTGARQTFVPVDAGGRPLGPAIVWSDRRAALEATTLADAMGGAEPAFDRTGVPLDAGSVAAKIAWLADHDRQRLAASAWLLAPRDLIAWRLTGEVVTDATMASRTGLYDVDGRMVGELAGLAATSLPPIVPSDQVSGRLLPEAASVLGLEVGTPVVIGAGDRPCEVLGAGAGEVCPMVSWGTTANVSLPLGDGPPVRPRGMVLSRAAGGGWLVEGGLSSAGSFVEWLGRLTGHRPTELSELARRSPPGARGVTATPWLDGARAPWWRPDAGAAFVGLSSDHGVADLARALFESVGWEVKRCLDAMDARRPEGPPAGALALGGAGAAVAVWVESLTGITGLAGTRRRSGQAASAGAALLAASAVGADFTLEEMDPVDEQLEPDPVAVSHYAGLQPRAERVVSAMIDLAPASSPVPAGRPPPSAAQTPSSDTRGPSCD